MMLDYLGSLACMILALSLIALSILTDPRRRHWMDLPGWVRFPLFPGAVVVFFRAIELFTIAGAPEVDGHIGLNGLFAYASVAYCFSAMTAHVLSKTYPIRVWDRMKWIEQKVSCRSSTDEVPAMIPRSKVMEMLGADASFISEPSYSVGAKDDAPIRAQPAGLH